MNTNSKGIRITLTFDLDLCLSRQLKTPPSMGFNLFSCLMFSFTNWAALSEFVSSSIPSWQILTVHAQPFRGARDLAFCMKVPLDSLLVWASSEGSGETARMRRLAWTFAARLGDKYQIRLTRPNYFSHKFKDRHVGIGSAYTRLQFGI